MRIKLFIALMTLSTGVAHAQVGIKYYVMTSTSGAVTQASPTTPRGDVAYFTATVGGTSANDGCIVEAGASDFTINRANGGVFICRMAAKYAYATGCAVGGNNTVMCSGDPLNSANYTNCSITTDGTNNGISECNP
jgi:hypothetical protein